MFGKILNESKQAYGKEQPSPTTTSPQQFSYPQAPQESALIGVKEPVNFENANPKSGRDQGSDPKRKQSAFGSIMQDVKGPVINKKKGQYDPFKSPPDLSFCHKHGEASLVGVDPVKNLVKERDPNKRRQILSQVCPCCMQFPNKEKIPLCKSTSQLSFLGAGFPLYFDFLKFALILLTIAFAIAGAYLTIVNYTSKNCDKVSLAEELKIGNSKQKFCGARWKIQFSAGNNKDFREQDPVMDILIAILFAVMLIIKTVYLARVMKYDSVIDANVTTPNDYTLRFDGVPRDVTEQEVAEYFTKNGLRNKETPVEKVNFAFYIKDYVDLTQKRNTLEKNYYWAKKENKPIDQLVILNKELDDVKGKLLNLKAELTSGDKQGYKNKYFTGIAFVTFKCQLDCSHVLERYQLGPIGVLVTKYFKCLQCLFPNRWPAYKLKNGQKKTMQCQLAPEPSDINWENLGVAKKTKFKRRLINALITALFFLVSFGTITGIKFAHKTVVQDSFKSLSVEGMLLSIFISFLISFINALMGFTMRRISSYEFYSTVTDLTKAVAWRISFVQFFNSSIVLIVANYIIYGKQLRENMWTDGGLANDAWFIMLTNILVNPMSGFFNPFHILRCFKKRQIIKQDQQNKCKLNQKEANFWFEGPPIDMAQRYTNNNKTLLVTFFFIPILPMGLICAIAAVIIAFWMDKYLLLRRHGTPPMLSSNLAISMVSLLDLVLIFYATCLLKCFSFTNKEAEESKKRNMTYEKARVGFAQEYDRSNPVTQNEATVEWLRWKRNIINKIPKDKGGPGHAALFDGLIKQTTQDQDQMMAKGLDAYANYHTPMNFNTGLLDVFHGPQLGYPIPPQDVGQGQQYSQQADIGFYMLNLGGPQYMTNNYAFQRQPTAGNVFGELLNLGGNPYYTQNEAQYIGSGQQPLNQQNMYDNGYMNDNPLMSQLLFQNLIMNPEMGADTYMNYNYQAPQHHDVMLDPGQIQPMYEMQPMNQPQNQYAPEAPGYGQPDYQAAIMQNQAQAQASENSYRPSRTMNHPYQQNFSDGPYQQQPGPYQQQPGPYMQQSSPYDQGPYQPPNNYPY